MILGVCLISGPGRASAPADRLGLGSSVRITALLGESWAPVFMQKHGRLIP
jgi:hypothetical protein